MGVDEKRFRMPLLIGNVLDIWETFGFRDNPYSVNPVPANDEGARLLVGREKELHRLKIKIGSSKAHPTIEGTNGVGKTSLVSVASYELYAAFLRAESDKPYIPVNPPFQLQPSDTVESFKERFYLKIAQHFISEVETLRGRGFHVPRTDEIEKWINQPINRSASGGASVSGFGGTFGKGEVPNLSSGFATQGFFSTVQGWLSDCFPDSKDGGFVCVVDNLELLDTSKTARELVEALRDEVLNLKGVYWVLCGARGIVRSVASSPRLQGRLGDPIELGAIPDDQVGEVVSRRISEYANSSAAQAPVDPRGFEHIYQIGNYNLRNAFKYAEDFALWLAEADNVPDTENEKFDLLEIWMAEMAEKYEQDTRGVKTRAWEIFDQICDIGGTTAPGEYAHFGFESQQAMRPHLKTLEEARLIESSVDESDNRRKTITLTSRGWIVRYKRKGFQI